MSLLSLTEPRATLRLLRKRSGQRYTGNQESPSSPGLLFRLLQEHKRPFLVPHDDVRIFFVLDIFRHNLRANP